MDIANSRNGSKAAVTPRRQSSPLDSRRLGIIFCVIHTTEPPSGFGRFCRVTRPSIAIKLKLRFRYEQRSESHGGPDRRDADDGSSSENPCRSCGASRVFSRRRMTSAGCTSSCSISRRSPSRAADLPRSPRKRSTNSGWLFIKTASASLGSTIRRPPNSSATALSSPSSPSARSVQRILLAGARATPSNTSVDIG